MKIERIKTKTFDGYLLSDTITNMLMNMEEARKFYGKLKKEFKDKKHWSIIKK